jgi:hypothetical protein
VAAGFSLWYIEGDCQVVEVFRIELGKTPEAILESCG